MLENVALFALIGFLAQIIDGALGMAYGVSATTFLLSFGVSPALASASVHAAECVTTAFSGLSHLGFGNVDQRLFKRLVLPGVVGAVLGAYVLTRFPGDLIKPWIAAYLLVMGIYILIKAFRNIMPASVGSHPISLGLVGGLMDAVGGGGWGPIVVSTLVARGNDPRLTIGSANLAEFFVALTASLTFVVSIGRGELNNLWPAIAGLAIGGAFAAPLAALLTRRIKARTLMFMVGVLIALLSLRTMLQTLGVF
ncbi:MAG: sulfite exporter TauE/SafE family protein [Chloroflexota bacterium]